MSNEADYPPDSSPEPDFKPWEQRSAPGAGGSGGGSAPDQEKATPERLCQEMRANELHDLLERQTDLAYYPMVSRHITPVTNLRHSAYTNQQVWQLFLAEELYDTRRVTLEHFHLFEWFPVAPGRFHTADAQQQRQIAYEMMLETPGGRSYFNPWGKASMIKGGVGAVRLRPRLVADEPHYFMTVSSNGVCHEGFPVLVPRRFYGPLKSRLLSDGAVPVTLSGEMRYLYQDAPTFFNARRDIPLLYLHVDQVDVLPAPRPGIEQFSVSVAIAFIGQFENQPGVYATYATFNPAQPASLQRAVQWLEQFYVTQQHRGVVITDFDEVQTRFPGTVFGLPDLMAGKMDPSKISAFLQLHGYPAQSGQPFFAVYKEINTMGGAYIEGNLDTGGGDFIGRDKNISVNIGGEVSTANITVK